MKTRVVQMLVAVVLPLMAARADVARTEGVANSVEQYRIAHEAAIVRELVDFIAIPNVARDPENIEKNVARLIEMLESRGVPARRLEVEGAPPSVLGTLDVPGATRTLIFYAHYDGQPALATEWESEPWQPVLRTGTIEDGAEVVSLDGIETFDPEWRIYGRSASDDKSPIIAMLTALDALRDARIAPSVNLRFFFEGEEEAGSDHLDEILEKYADLLTADLWLFCDGPVHQSRRGLLAFGVRGVVDLEMTVYGPIRALHSGHYGNWAPNPGVMLAELITSMRDSEGKILVDGFAEQTRSLDTAAREALASIPDSDADLMKDLGLARAEGNNGRLIERIMLPALNVRGIEVGGVGENARNAIPIEAKASFDFRLVPDVTPDTARALVEAHIRRQGYYIVREEPDLEVRRKHAKIARLLWGEGYPALRTPMDHPGSVAVIEAVEEARGEVVVKIPNFGGSLPLYMFDEILGTPLAIVPMVNHDNNQHAKNENLRIANLWQGIAMYANLMARLGQLWR